MQLGKDISISADASTILSLTSVELQTESDSIDITTLDSNQLEEIITDKKSMSLSLSGKRDDAAAYSINDLLDAQIAGTKIAIIITYENVAIGERQTCTVTMLAEDYTEDQPDGGEVTQSITLQSDGAPVWANRAA